MKDCSSLSPVHRSMFMSFQMMKLNRFPSLFLKRTVYTAIKAINESPAPSSRPVVTAAPGRMQAWIIYYYGANQQLTLSDSVQMPMILSPNDVLIKVIASSVNPIDIRRRGTAKHHHVLWFDRFRWLFFQKGTGKNWSTHTSPSRASWSSGIISRVNWTFQSYWVEIFAVKSYAKDHRWPSSILVTKYG